MPSISSPATYSTATASGVGTGGFNTVTAQQGWLLNAITTSVTVSVGDVYQGNSNNFTVLAALTSQLGQVLFLSGASSLGAATTLTKLSGQVGSTATITFTNAAGNPLSPVALYPYTLPSTRISSLEIELGGGGGGGIGVNAGQSTVAGTSGGSTVFGVLFAAALGGQVGASYNIGGVGGGHNFSSAPWTGSTYATLTDAVDGGSGSGGENFDSNVVLPQGGPGGASTRGGNGGGGGVNTAGYAAATNSGSGGGGAGNTAGLVLSTSGGGAGATLRFVIPKTNLQTTFLYAVGPGGTGGASTYSGGNGAAGWIKIKENYGNI